MPALQNLSPMLIIIIQLIAVLAITIFCSLLEWIIYRCVYPHLCQTKNLWDDILFRALHPPLQTVIWLVGLTYLMSIAANLIPKLQADEIIYFLRALILAVTMVWFLLRYIHLFEIKLMASMPDLSKKPLDRAKTLAIGKLLRVSVAIIAVLIFLQVIGVPISGLLAFGGAGAIIAGLAAKDVLANFFGGLMIYTDRPFTVGDWIRSPDHEIEGTVEHIGWRLTRIRTFDLRPLYVPNAIFSSIAIENPSRMHNRRIKTVIGLCYENIGQIEPIIAELNTMLTHHAEVDHRQPSYARLIQFAESSLNIQISVFTKATETAHFLRVQEAILLKIAEIVKKHNAEFAFPTHTIYSK